MSAPSLAPTFSRDASRHPQRLDHCLRVAPDLAILAMPDGLGVQVRGLDTPLVLRGRGVDAALAFLLPRLDGHTTNASLIREAPPHLSRESVRACLALLEDARVVQSAAVPLGGDGAAMSRATLYWSRRASAANDSASTQTPRRRIAAARVTLIATGLFGRATEELLRELGCARVRTLAWDDDVAEAQRRARDHMCLDTTSISRAMRVLRPWIAESSLVVSATRHAPDALLSAINRECLTVRVPFLRANEASTIDVGPTVLPFASACFECVRARAASVDPLAIEERLYQDHLEQERPAGHTKPKGEHAPIARLGASLVTCEAARILSGASRPMLENTVASVCLREGTVTHDAIVRVPQCDACGDANPREVRPTSREPPEVRHG